jgi:hypothetical protein
MIPARAKSGSRKVFRLRIGLGALAGQLLDRTFHHAFHKDSPETSQKIAQAV